MGTINEQNMNVLFYGNGGAGNHGCEAIVRGSVQILGEVTYTIISENVAEDIQYGLDSISKIIPAKADRRRDFSFLKAYTKLKLTGNYTDMDGWHYLPVIRELHNCAGVALSVGGDNYCYGNTAIYGYLNAAYKKNHIKTVLWGCSIEPDVVKEPSVAEDLRRYALVAARESITYEAVKAVGANVVQMPDPAFHMQPETCDTDERFLKSNVVGINISPHIIVSEGNHGAAYANYKALIQHILDNTDAYIALIPHVVWANNDDRIPLKQLYDDFDQNRRLILVDDHTGAGTEIYHFSMQLLRWCPNPRDHRCVFYRRSDTGGGILRQSARHCPGFVRHGGWLRSAGAAAQGER